MKYKIFTVLVWILIGINLSFADTLTLPEPKGSYGVGTVNIELSDPSRTQLRSSEKRRFMATVFYPTDKNQNTHPYMPGTLDDGIVRGQQILGHAIPNASPHLNKRFSVIISFPGRGGERQKESILYEALASHGYIVITMDQPYVANFVKFPDGTKTTLTFKDVWNLPRDRDYRYKYDDEVIGSAIKDIDFVLQNFGLFGDLSNIFDTSKIILMGHSIGGNIAQIKGFADKRIKAVVDIDSKITEREVFGRVGVFPNLDAKPVLFIRGMMEYQEDVGDQLTKIANSTIWSPYVPHSAFSDDDYFAAKIPNYNMNLLQALYNWFFKRGPYFSGTDTNLGDHTVDEWFVEYPEYIVKWLDKNI
jgi:pimeloyl-ACP methyl ester carboxylesterase